MSNIPTQLIVEDIESIVSQWATDGYGGCSVSELAKGLRRSPHAAFGAESGRRWELGGKSRDLKVRLVEYAEQSPHLTVVESGRSTRVEWKEVEL